MVLHSRFEFLLEDKQEFSLGRFDVTPFYICSDRTLYQNLHLNLHILPVFHSISVGFGTAAVCYLFYRKSEIFTMNLESGDIHTGRVQHTRAVYYTSEETGTHGPCANHTDRVRQLWKPDQKVETNVK